jgi:hypothetical protein
MIIQLTFKDNIPEDIHNSYRFADKEGLTDWIGTIKKSLLFKEFCLCDDEIIFITNDNYVGVGKINIL